MQAATVAPTAESMSDMSRKFARMRLSVVMMAGLLPLSVPELVHDALETVDGTVDELTDAVETTVATATAPLAPAGPVTTTESAPPAQSAPATDAPSTPQEALAAAALEWAWWATFAAILAGAFAIIIASGGALMRTHWLAIFMRAMMTALLIALGVSLAFVDFAMWISDVPFEGVWLFATIVAWLAIVGGLVATQRVGEKAGEEPEPRRVPVTEGPKPAHAEGPTKTA